MGCVLGLRTSYDRSFANGLCIGASVFVCDNLSFRGEVTFERKHTVGMLRDLTWMISETVSTLPMRFVAQSVTFETYKQREMGDKDVHDIAIRLWDAGALARLKSRDSSRNGGNRDSRNLAKCRKAPAISDGSRNSTCRLKKWKGSSPSGSPPAGSPPATG